MSLLTYQPLLESLWQTVYMVFIASFLSIILGLGLGVALFSTRKQQLLTNPLLNQILSFIVNVVRSVPFIILMIAIIPFTRLLVGSTIGTNAAIVPLTLAAIPFYARIAEAAFLEVPTGLREAALAMGATPLQTIYKILIPEALPSLINGATLTVIALIGYSAMAGAVGGGGLGELAIQYGYQRFDVMVMLQTVVILVVLVQLIQWLGDIAARHRSLKWIGLSVAILWVAVLMSLFWHDRPVTDTLKVGIVSGPMSPVMQVAQQVAEQKYGLHIKVVEFDDYILPNSAVNDGELDANIFQHVPYLDSQIAARGYKLAPIAKTFVYPMGIYSRKVSSISQLRVNAVIGIPNDPSNEGRALLLLQKAKLIALRPKVGLLATPNDITANPEHLQITTLDAAQLARVVPDVDAVVLNNDYVTPAGFKPSDAIFVEGPDSPYANIIVARSNDNDPLLQKLILVMHSRPVVEEVYKLFPNGAAIPAWRGAPMPPTH